jgi:alpha-L-rhamnosidase
MLVTNLRCEYAENPLGIDVREPRFSWQLHDERRAAYTKAYQVLVASSLELLQGERGDRWDSGKVLSSTQVSIGYAGSALESTQRYYWKVRAWDFANQPTGWSDTAWFEMGLLDQAEWVSLWYGYPAGYSGRALYFRSIVNITKPIKRARAYVAGLGLFEYYVNGLKTNDHVLEPAQTDYSSRVFYTTIDIGPFLHTGRNGLGAIVGHGWHGAPKLRAQIHIDYVDGTRVVLHMTRTGMSERSDWSLSAGPIVSDSIYDGEVYDARLERDGWCDPEQAKIADDPRQPWLVPVPVDGPAGIMQAQPLEPIRIVEHVEPLSVSEAYPGIYVFDMGQNMVGWVRLRVSGLRGHKVSILFSENLDEDGTVDQGNLRSAVCTDTYILKGGEREEWEPRFTYHGFRYVQVEGYPGQPGPDAILGCVVHSDVAQRGRFECSNDLLNRLQHAVLWTESGNLHGLPTDCPQRDERMGWLNDMTVRAEEALYNFDVNRLHAKWITDIHDVQDPLSGAIPDTAPYRMGARPADPVTMCYLLVPWLLYQHHGNSVVMEEHYDGLKAWVDYLSTRAPGDIVDFSYYGDWSPPVGEAVQTSQGAGAVSANTPGRLMSTGYYYLGSRLIAQMAAVLGKPDDEVAYRQQTERIGEAFNRTFWDPVNHVYGSGNQACCSFSLYMGLVPADRQATVLDTLMRDVVAHDYHLTTGNLCSKYLLEVLSAYGRHDVAYRLATQTTYPSWGYMLACGATTIWERWENTKEIGMHSRNHPMMATFSAWFYRYLAGIQLSPDAVGFDRFSIRPYLVYALDHVTASVQTVHGVVESVWQRQDDCLHLHALVPVNCTARIGVPKPKSPSYAIYESGELVWKDGASQVSREGLSHAQDDGDWVTFTAGSGSYEFEARL